MSTSLSGQRPEGSGPLAAPSPRDPSTTTGSGLESKDLGGPSVDSAPDPLRGPSTGAPGGLTGVEF